jgi:hypothetical protein
VLTWRTSVRHFFLCHEQLPIPSRGVPQPLPAQTSQITLRLPLAMGTKLGPFMWPTNRVPLPP